MNENDNNSIIKVDGVFNNGEKQSTPLFAPDNSPSRGLLIRTINDFTTFEVSTFVPSTDAATAGLYPVFYITTVPCFLLEAKLRHDVNGGAGATIDVERIIDGVAKGSGGSMLKTKFVVSAGAKTTISTGGSIASSGFQLNPGDAVALKATGTLTNLANVAVTLLFGINMRDIPLSKAATTFQVEG